MEYWERIILMSLVVFILFFPKTYLHGDAPGYVKMTEFYLGRVELDGSTIELCRTNRPLLPWISALPYALFQSPYILLAINSLVAVIALLSLMKICRGFGLTKKESFYSGFAMLFSKYYFNYGFTLFVYILSLLMLLWMWKFTFEKNAEWKVGLMGLLALLAVPTAVTGIFLPAVHYFSKGKFRSILKYTLVLFVLLGYYQAYTTVAHGCNYFIDKDWKTTEYSPGSIWSGLFFGTENVGFKNGIVPSFIAVMHAPLTLMMLIGFLCDKNKKLQLGFWFTLATSLALIVYWKEDGLRMFVSFLPFASMYAGRGIGLLVNQFEKRVPFAEGFVLSVIAISSILLSSKWVWIFDIFS